MDAHPRALASRPRPRFALAVPRQPTPPCAEHDMPKIEDYALVEHQPVTPSVGRHEADTATGSGSDIAGEPPAVGKDNLAGTRCLTAEQHGKQVGRASPFDTCEADNLTRLRRERDAAKRPARQVAHHQLARLALRAPRRQWREHCI